MSTEQLEVLESARQMALQYSEKLPDFICTQITRRSVSSDTNIAGGLTGNSVANSVSVAAQRGDVIEEKLTFFDHTENYEVVSLNGRAVSGLDHMQFQGAITSGEFGSAMHDIFNSESQAIFTWEHSDNLHGRRVYIYGFRVPKEKGLIVTHHNPEAEVVVSYGGRVYIDAETRAILRITSTLDLPAKFPIHRANRMVEYKAITIAAKSYMLPARSEVHMRDSARSYDNTIEFKNYHKYAATSTIYYDEQP